MKTFLFLLYSTAGKARRKILLATRYSLLATAFALCANAAPLLYSIDFSAYEYGSIPAGWTDLINYRPARNWAVDSLGYLRPVTKEYVGNPTHSDRLIRRTYLESFGFRHFTAILAYNGALSNAGNSTQLTDIIASSTFKSTPDTAVTFALLLRLQDHDNYYAARISGQGLLEILKIADNKETLLASIPSVSRLTETSNWTLQFSAIGDLLSATIFNPDGSRQSYLFARDSSYKQGSAAIAATTFAAAKNFSLKSPSPITEKLTPAQIRDQNKSQKSALQQTPYPVLPPAKNPAQLDTPFTKLSSDYDLIVAGGGTGGFGAALQSARLGAKTLLLEETDYIGGQMANAGVTSMDEGGFWGKNTARERGIYREFHESAVLYYYSLNKDPFTAYHFNRQSEGGFEPLVARNILYSLINETRHRTLPDNTRPVLDLCPRTKVTAVQKTGNTITGATITEWTPTGPRTKQITCRVLIDATEYGDLIPLTGARYRVGTSTSDNIDPKSPMQQHTWLGILKEYPHGIPDHLKIKTPPPNYDQIKHRFRNYALHGKAYWGSAPDTPANPRVWWTYTTWRGMADSSSSATGALTELRHTKTGLNGGNDYDVTAATAENPQQRLADETVGINKTLGIIYWLQNEIGVPYSVTDDEPYNTPFNLDQMRRHGIREDLLELASRLPQLPYARESRRIIGVETLRSQDLYLRDKENDASRHWASSLSINDYSFDLHGTNDALENDLDEPNYINATGPFLIPFGVFIPEKIDGFLPAEKNISQSRLANGATRLQPSTMLNGQAVGTIAALAVQQKIQPRQLNIIDVQVALLNSGQCLISRWYSDIAWGTPLWRATQLLSLYGILDRPGAFSKSTPLATNTKWGANEKLTLAEINQAYSQFKKLIPASKLHSIQLPSPKSLLETQTTRAQFALQLATLIAQNATYRLTDPAPYTDPNYPANLAAARAKAAKSEKLKKEKAAEPKAAAKAKKAAAKKSKNTPAQP